MTKATTPDEQLWGAPDQRTRLTELTSNSPKVKVRPLRRDVRSLGRLLGRCLVEQEGVALFEAVEALRRMAIRQRNRQARTDDARQNIHANQEVSSIPAVDEQELAKAAEKIIKGMTTHDSYHLTKAFATYFELINLAETNHRKRRRLAAQLLPGRPTQPGTLLGTLRRMKDAGITRESAVETLNQIEIIPVFTAHPTEVARRTVLFKRRRIAQELERLDRLPLTDEEAVRAENSIAAEISALWQTDEVQRRRPTVIDEIKMGLDYYDACLIDSLPNVYDDIAEVFQQVYGEPLAAREIPTCVSFGSWIGGDRDGNPFVTPEATREALRMARHLILGRYIGSVAGIMDRLSSSAKQVAVSPALTEKLKVYAEHFPHVAIVNQTRSPALAERSLELMIAATLEALTRSAGTPAQEELEEWELALESMSRDAFEFYRENVYENPDILPYFEEATPVLELEHARIGSRPSRRGQSRGLHDLRAIPWVFGWMQSRQVLPAWFGVGHALEKFAAAGEAGLRLLQTMVTRFPLFEDFVSNVEMGMAKADLSIAALYAELVDDSALRTRVFKLVTGEFERTKRMILLVTGQSRLLERNPVLARSISLRNPYVDPLSLIQVELLKRKRAGEDSEQLNYALAATINGIAAGLRNTG